MILYTNDIHCAVDSGIGYADLASLQNQYEADGNAVLLVDCGDAIQGEPIGTLSEGEYIIDIINEVGYDVAAIGNHDFKEGGGGMNMFQDDTLLQDSVMLDNQILIQYITDYLGGLIGSDYANPYGQGRINIR